MFSDKLKTIEATSEILNLIFSHVLGLSVFNHRLSPLCFWRGLKISYEVTRIVSFYLFKIVLHGVLTI